MTPKNIFYRILLSYWNYYYYKTFRTTGVTKPPQIFKKRTLNILFNSIYCYHIIQNGVALHHYGKSLVPNILYVPQSPFLLCYCVPCVFLYSFLWYSCHHFMIFNVTRILLILSIVWLEIQISKIGLSAITKKAILRRGKEHL